MLRDYTRIRTYGHERIQQNEQRTCGNQILSASHLTRRSRATPPRTEAAALTTLAKHGAATSAASCRAAMLLLVLIGVACRGQARGDEPRAERARHGRHCLSSGVWRRSRRPPAGSRPPYWAARGTRIQRRGQRGARQSRNGGGGQEPGARRDAGAGRAMYRGRRNERGERMEHAEEVRRSHEERRRRLARIGRPWAGAAIGSAKCSTGGVEGRGRLEEGGGWGV